MGRQTQNMPRALRGPARTQPTSRAKRRLSRKTLVASLMLGLLAATAAVAALALQGHDNTLAQAERRTNSAISSVLTGIPEQGNVLGSPRAPVTLEIHADLKDPDCQNWFLDTLPLTIEDFVRTGVLKLEYRSFKTNTKEPSEFIRDQTAALAAGAQNELWYFVLAFYAAQRSEFATYATEGFLEQVARQVPGLDIARWHVDRHTGRREEQTVSEDQAARALGLHVTPSFRIGRSGGRLRNFSGHSVTKYGEQHPIALPTAQDVGKAIEALGIGR